MVGGGDSNSRHPACKAGALPTELTAPKCINPNGGYSRSLVKLMHKQKNRAMTRERSECVSALSPRAVPIRHSRPRYELIRQSRDDFHPRFEVFYSHNLPKSKWFGTYCVISAAN